MKLLPFVAETSQGSCLEVPSAHLLWNLTAELVELAVRVPVMPSPARGEGSQDPDSVSDAVDLLLGLVSRGLCLLLDQVFSVGFSSFWRCLVGQNVPEGEKVEQAETSLSLITALIEFFVPLVTFISYVLLRGR